MGTNFYMITRDKSVILQYFLDGEYQLTDFPHFGYEVHVAKTSLGWLPLFQGYQRIESVNDFERAYNAGGFEIYDEYGILYSSSDFYERVLKHNGGTKSNCVQDQFGRTPISHFDYDNGKNAYHYYTDPDGYEFTKMGFS